MPFIILLIVRVIGYFLAGLAIQVAWNMSMTDLFGLPEATYVNGVGLALLFLWWNSTPEVSLK